MSTNSDVAFFTEDAGFTIQAQTRKPFLADELRASGLPATAAFLC